MAKFIENASVIYTNEEGKQFDTFVIFDTDPITGLTQINHENLRVPASSLKLHSKTACNYHLPIADAFSFEMLKKLKDKYTDIDQNKKVVKPINAEVLKMYPIAEAS